MNGVYGVTSTLAMFLAFTGAGFIRGVAGSWRTPRLVAETKKLGRVFIIVSLLLLLAAFAGMRHVGDVAGWMAMGAGLALGWPIGAFKRQG